MIALVTGSSHGIGKAIALELAGAGYTVVLSYRSNAARAKATLAAVQHLSKESSLVRADLANPAEVNKMFGTIAERYGQLDAMVHTVGDFGHYLPISEISIKEYDAIWQSNVITTALCIKAALTLLEHSEQGRIVTFACADAEYATSRKFTAAYYMAKQAVITLTKSWAVALAAQHITVNAIAPGIVETSLVKQPTPMGRPAKSTDIAQAVRFLLSSEASYISGAVLPVSGSWRPGL